MTLSLERLSCRENRRLKAFFATEIESVKDAKARDLWLLARKVAQQDMKITLLIDGREELMQAAEAAHAKAAKLKVWQVPALASVISRPGQIYPPGK